jgi:hypothetical protein
MYSPSFGELREGVIWGAALSCIGVGLVAILVEPTYWVALLGVTAAFSLYVCFSAILFSGRRVIPNKPFFVWGLVTLAAASVLCAASVNVALEKMPRVPALFVTVVGWGVFVAWVSWRTVAKRGRQQLASGRLARVAQLGAPIGAGFGGLAALTVGGEYVTVFMALILAIGVGYTVNLHMTYHAMGLRGFFADSDQG